MADMGLAPTIVTLSSSPIGSPQPRNDDGVSAFSGKGAMTMAKPPSSPPSSDIGGVHRDWRPGLHSTDSEQDPGSKIDQADKKSVGQPNESKPDENAGG
jgi:hypothetical protein